MYIVVLIFVYLVIISDMILVTISRPEKLRKKLQTKSKRFSKIQKHYDMKVYITKWALTKLCEK